MLKDLASRNNIKFILVSFTDLFGVVRSKLVPASAIDLLEKNGAAFAGFAAHFDVVPADPDIVVFPDPTTFTVLSWKPEVAWVTGDLFTKGMLFDQSPRNLLKLRMEEERASGYYLKTGAEAEFFLLSPDNNMPFDHYDRQAKPCYDQLALMRCYEVISEICGSLEELGWEPYQNDHEDANGQFEINWGYNDALTTADRHTFFKFAVKSIAEKHNMKASFMPKPFETLTGNGCHVHCSLWDSGGNNLFPAGAGEHELNQTGLNFVGGLLEHGPALCALTNPEVNSYKRLNANSTISGATWIAQNLCWSGDNRANLIRVPDTARCELRLPDGAANPYLLQLGILAAGMGGIRNAIDPGKPNETFFSSQFNINRLPLSIVEALEYLKSDHWVNEYIGEGLVKSYVKLRSQKWHNYMRSVSQWELSNTLDC